MTEKRIVLITGATSGLGLETARCLAEQGHTIIVSSRGKEKVEATCASLRETTNNSHIYGLELNLSSLAAVKAAAEELLSKQDENWAFDTLILNAGMSGPNSGLQTTPEGFEITFATNHLGHYYFTRLLSERLIQNAKARQRRARVVIVSSGTHDPANRTPLPHPVFDLEQWKLPKSYNPPLCYSQSKLANALFANDLAAQYDPQELSVAAYDPGLLTTTNLSREAGAVLRHVLFPVVKFYLHAVSYIYGSTNQVGAMERSAPFLARLGVDDALLSVTGEYYCVDVLDKCSEVAATRQCQIELREFSDKLLQEKGFAF